MLREDLDTPLYMIGIVAQMLSLHPQTLGLYEKEGLVVPGRSQGNTRLYSDRDVERLRSILHLTRDMGVNLAGIEIIIRMRDQMDQMQREMGDLMIYIKEEIRKELSEKLNSNPSFGQTKLKQKSNVTEKQYSGKQTKKVIRVKVEKDRRKSNADK